MPATPQSLLEESSLTLLERARAGDQEALNVLLERYRPRLVTWARRRLRPEFRDICDTDDLVQNTLIKVIRNLQSFESQGATGLQHYLRLSIANALRDEIKKATRRPPIERVDEALWTEAPSPFEQAALAERMERYERGLAQLHPDEREAIIARFELGFTHDELAAVLGKGTSDAARKLCRRALVRLLAYLDVSA